MWALFSVRSVLTYFNEVSSAVVQLVEISYDLCSGTFREPRRKGTPLEAVTGVLMNAVAEDTIGL
jgi:hypothetical protein